MRQTAEKDRLFRDGELGPRSGFSCHRIGAFGSLGDTCSVQPTADDISCVKEAWLFGTTTATSF